jgi:hypothetical protein
MPRPEDVGFEFGFKVSPDGLIHTVRQESAKSRDKKRKDDIHNASTFEDAAVCLSCTKPRCDGERECFLKQKKLMKSDEQRG